MVSLPATTWPLAKCRHRRSIVGDEAAGFADQERTRRQIPRRKIALPIGIEPAGGDPGKIERRRAIAAQSGEMLLCRGDLVPGQTQIAAAQMRQAAGDDGIGKALARRDPDALVVEERALAALGDEELVVRRIIDDAGNDRARALKPDRHREMRNAVQEIGGAIERVDDPAVGLVAALMRAAFLTEKAVIRPRLGKVLAHDRLGAVIGGGDEIARPLHGNLQMLDLAEIALETAAGAMRGLDHDIDDGGVEHGCFA